MCDACAAPLLEMPRVPFGIGAAFLSLRSLGDHHVTKIVAKARSALQEAAAFKNRGVYVARYYWVRLLPAFPLDAGVP